MGPKAARVSAAVHAEMSLVLADFHTSMSSGPLPGLACTAPMTADPTACEAVAGDAGPAAEAKPEVKKRPEDDIHVEAQIDQAVFDKLVAEGKSERVARAKAKAAYVRAEKKRILAEQQGSEGGDS